MINSKIYKHLFESGLAFLALVMLVLPNFITVALLLFLVVLIIGGVKKEISLHWNLINTLFVLFYLIYFVGSFYTNNQGLANKYLEYKLVFLVFPLIFSFKLKGGLSIQKPVLAAISGVLILSIFGVVHSNQLYLENGSISSFFGSNFSYIHHPTYYSLYALFSLASLQEVFRKRWLGKYKITYLLVGLWLIVIQLISVSLAGILFLLLFAGVIFLLKVKGRFGVKWFLTTLIISPILLIGILNYTPGLKTQFNTTIKYIKEYVKDPVSFIEVEQTYVQGDEVRLIMWTVTLLEIIDHPFGVGTGNSDDHLHERLLEYQQFKVAKINYNPHNQFLQTTLEIGVVGLGVFLFIIGYSVYQGWRHKNNLLLALTFCLAFNCLFESMLQRQSGIVFYTFWICLLVAVNLNPKIELDKG